MKNKKENLELILAEQQRYVSILTNLNQILISAENHAQAQVIQNLIELLHHKNITGFEKSINSIDMWGGSGAVWEVYIADKTAAREFEKEIINLIDLMEQTNFLGKRIKPIRKIFKENLSHSSS